MEPLKIAFVLCGLTIYTSGAPALHDEYAGMSPLLTVKDGNLVVNFLGSKASAGEGGPLENDASQGFHSAAETAFQQNAQGLGAPLTPVAKSKPEGHPQEMPHWEEPTNDSTGKLRSRRWAAPQWNPDTAKKPNRAEVVQNIFNVPISVLQAVSKLVSILPPGPLLGTPKRCGYNCQKPEFQYKLPNY